MFRLSLEQRTGQYRESGSDRVRVPQARSETLRDPVATALGTDRFRKLEFVLRTPVTAIDWLDEELNG